MPSRNDYEYSCVVSTDSEETIRAEKPPFPRRRRCKPSVSGIGWTITTTLLMTIIWILSHSTHHMMSCSTSSTPTTSPYAQTWTDCGSSPIEARSRGCKFDILSFAWQLPECYDKKIMDEFMAEKTWQFFQHPNGTGEVSAEFALSGEHDLYVTQEYHHVHCMYMWRQMHRAFTVQGYIDSHLNDYHHTLHCHHVMLHENAPKDSIGAIGALKYPSCEAVAQSKGMTDTGLY